MPLILPYQPGSPAMQSFQILPKRARLIPLLQGQLDVLSVFTDTTSSAVGSAVTGAGCVTEAAGACTG
jgi:hypothetical protein